MMSKAIPPASVLVFLQTLWRVMTGLLRVGTTASQRLGYACIQHFTGKPRRYIASCGTLTGTFLV